MSKLKTARGLVEFANSKIGTIYAYGAKGQVLTPTLIYSLAKESPNVYTKAYINQLLDLCKKHPGARAVDCSGLISWYTGIIRGSSNFESTGTNKISPSKLDDGKFGWAVWKPGHIGVVESGTTIIEAKGINYGTIRSKTTATPWEKAFQIVDIDYQAEEGLQGWIKCKSGYTYFRNGNMVKSAWILDKDRWYVVDGSGLMIHDNWFYEGGKWYYLAGDGGMISNQWLNYKDKWYYFDAIGVCLTDTWYKYKDEWYYLDDTGAMHKGMLYDNGEWYYLGEDGKLVTDKTIKFDARDDGALKFSGLINKED